MGMIPKAGTLIGRAGPNIGTETPNASSMLLGEEMTTKFVSRVVGVDGMLAVARKQVIKGSGRIQPIFDIAEGQMVGGLGEWESVDDADMATTNYTDSRLIPQPFDFAWDYNALLAQYSAEGPAHEGNVDTAMQLAIKNEFERIALMSDTAGSDGNFAPGNMTTIDGWWVKGLTGHVYDYEGSFISPAIFEGAFKRMPFKYRSAPARKAKMRFWVNDEVVIDYRALLSRVPNGLGSLSLTQENQVQFAGITLTENGYMSKTLPGVMSQSESAADFTGVLLCENDNLVFGFGPEMKLTKTPDKSGKFTTYYWWGLVDVGYEDVDRVVAVANIDPSLDPTLPVFAGL